MKRLAIMSPVFYVFLLCLLAVTLVAMSCSVAEPSDVQNQPVYVVTYSVNATHHIEHENEGSDEIDVAGLSGLLADDQHVLDAEVLAVAAAATHGIAQHTDTTRTKFIDVSIESFSGTVLNWVSISGIRLSTGVDTYAQFSMWDVPTDFVSFISLELVWTGTGLALGQDWVCDPNQNFMTEGEIGTTHADNPANTTLDMAAENTLYMSDIGLTMANLAKSDYSGGRIWRRGTDEVDTYDGYVTILGLLLTYTAEQ